MTEFPWMVARPFSGADVNKPQPGESICQLTCWLNHPPQQTHLSCQGKTWPASNVRTLEHQRCWHWNRHIEQRKPSDSRRSLLLPIFLLSSWRNALNQLCEMRWVMRENSCDQSTFPCSNLIALFSSSPNISWPHEGATAVVWGPLWNHIFSALNLRPALPTKEMRLIIGYNWFKTAWVGTKKAIRNRVNIAQQICK